MGGIKKGIWVARDQNGNLFAYLIKPKVRTFLDIMSHVFIPNSNCANKYGSSMMQLPSSWYKNIKFENSPVFVPLTEDFIKQFIKK